MPSWLAPRDAEDLFRLACVLVFIGLVWELFRRMSGRARGPVVYGRNRWLCAGLGGLLAWVLLWDFKTPLVQRFGASGEGTIQSVLPRGRKGTTVVFQYEAGPNDFPSLTQRVADSRARALKEGDRVRLRRWAGHPGWVALEDDGGLAARRARRSLLDWTLAGLAVGLGAYARRASRGAAEA